MTTHFSIPAWEIPWTGKPGRLQSMGSQRAGHDLVTKEQQQHRNLYFLQMVIYFFLAVLNPHCYTWTFFRIDWFDLLEIQGTLKSLLWWCVGFSSW